MSYFIFHIRSSSLADYLPPDDGDDDDPLIVLSKKSPTNRAALSGKVVKWFKEEGDIIIVGDNLCDVETPVSFGLRPGGIFCNWT